jgi:hypothetical protein
LELQFAVYAAQKIQRSARQILMNPRKNVFKDHCVMRTKDENLNDLPLKASALTASYYGLR